MIEKIREVNVISILYITTYYPSQTEKFRGHFIEKQASLLGNEMNEKVIVFKPLFSGRSLKKEVQFEKINNIEVYTLIYPNFLKYLSLYSSSERALKYFSEEIRTIMNNDPPKLIVSNDIWASIKIGNLIKKIYNCKHFSVIHGENTNIKRIDKRLKYKVNLELLSCDKIFTVSNKTKKYIIREFNYEKDIIVNANGIEDEVISKYSHMELEKKDILTITSVGNLNYNKGFDIVLHALKNLNIPFKFHIIGDGIYKKTLLGLTKKYNITDKVYFTGNIDNAKVFDYLEESHFFILPSRNEAFGIVYLEAMITQNICIATKGEGPEDFIDNKVNGFLIKDEEEISQIILNYYNKNERDKIIIKARETAKRYTWKKNVEQIKDEFLKL